MQSICFTSIFFSFGTLLFVSRLVLKYEVREMVAFHFSFIIQGYKHETELAAYTLCISHGSINQDTERSWI